MSNGLDYWRVNSYGYPNPFSDDPKAQQAWNTFLSFFDFSSYSRLKTHWGSQAATRRLDAHAVESWKAAFEEFGLLYVISRTDTIQITPAGRQFRDAGERGDKTNFGHIGLSLLLRYPLRGPRRPKSPKHRNSDLLLYWFLYAAILELESYIWWTELERVLCTVFYVEEAQQAVENIKDLRAGRLQIDDFPLPGTLGRGGFYNSLNQVIVHASMNYMLLDKSSDDAFYEGKDKERKHWIIREWIPTIENALGGRRHQIDCLTNTDFIARVPTAPDFAGDEEAYFRYLGALVNPISSAVKEQITVVNLQGENVAVLKEIDDYITVDKQHIRGQIAKLCKLERGQRLILSHDTNWTYITRDKTLISSNEISVTIQKARPITNRDLIMTILRGIDG
jgi:hypothetical protein